MPPISHTISCHKLAFLSPSNHVSVNFTPSTFSLSEASNILRQHSILLLCLFVGLSPESLSSLCMYSMCVCHRGKLGNLSLLTNFLPSPPDMWECLNRASLDRVTFASQVGSWQHVDKHTITAHAECASSVCRTED